MLLGEISMRVLAVGSYSNDFCPEIRERFVGVPEAASFRCTTSSEVFRIEVNDHVLFSKKILQSNVTPTAGRQAEIGCEVTNGDQFPCLQRMIFGERRRRRLR